MITVEFDYHNKLGMKRHFKCSAPQHWSEMNEEQFLLISKISAGAEVPDSVFFQTMYGIKRNLAKDLDDWYKYCLTNKAKYLSAKKASCSKFIIKNFGKLVAPAGMLEGVSLQQFMTVDTYYSRAKDEIGEAIMPNVDNMLGALYLAPHTAYFVEPGDKKTKLADIEANALFMRKQDYDRKVGAYLNWSMIKNFLSKAYPLLFPESTEKDAKNNKPTDWLNVFDNFVGDDIAHAEAYKTMEATDAFRIMNKRIHDYNQAKLKAHGK